MFQERFRRAYLASLKHHRFFYDDICEYGRPDGSKVCIYFIAGMNGTPGQIRFAFPSFVRRFGREIYVRGCYLPEFAATRPIWEKYLPGAAAAKRDQVARDLRELLDRFAHVYIIASSNGFYDLWAAAPRLPPDWEQRATLLWVACAPDHFEPSPWVSFFARWTGFHHQGFLWAALPNSNWLTWINPETSTHLRWRWGQERRLFHKEDVESRFWVAGLRWVYMSPDAFNDYLRVALEGARPPLAVNAYVLAASRDGYWYGRPPEALERTVDRYLSRREILRRPTSHLWVVTPDHLADYLDRVPDR